ncbi:MAG: hypothetical protein CUN54_06335 [Phototrophicales bacterium]|nr:MAG: hypothetical protein CUN54_06335 [Phototrophicales bacterium]
MFVKQFDMLRPAIYHFNRHWYRFVLVGLVMSVFFVVAQGALAFFQTPSQPSDPQLYLELLDEIETYRDPMLTLWWVTGLVWFLSGLQFFRIINNRKIYLPLILLVLSIAVGVYPFITNASDVQNDLEDLFSSTAILPPETTEAFDQILFLSYTGWGFLAFAVLFTFTNIRRSRRVRGEVRTSEAMDAVDHAVQQLVVQEAPPVAQQQVQQPPPPVAQQQTQEAPPVAQQQVQQPLPPVVQQSVPSPSPANVGEEAAPVQDASNMTDEQDPVIDVVEESMTTLEQSYAVPDETPSVQADEPEVDFVIEASSDDNPSDASEGGADDTSADEPLIW